LVNHKIKKIKSSYDLLGSLGVLGGILQSTIVKLGTQSEKSTKEVFINNGFEDMNLLCSIKKEETKSKSKKTKQYLFGNDFMDQFDPEKKYIGQKIVFTYEGRNIQTDLIIYMDKIFYIIELKSSSQFDTKKAKAEADSLFENTLVLNKLIYKSYKNKFENFKIKGAICCLDAFDNLEIFKGFKNFIVDNSDIWGDNDFSDIVRGRLTSIKRKDLFNEKDINVIIKAFVQSDIETHGFFELPIVKKYVNFVFTGEYMFDLFNLDYEEFCKNREKKAKETLMLTLDEKINEKEQPEMYHYLHGILKQFEAYDLSHNI